MAPGRTSKTPSKGNRGSGRKSKANKPDVSATKQKAVATTPTPKKPRKASDFIVKPSTSRKRPARSSPAPENDQANSVDDLIRNVRGLIEAGDPPAVRALEEAMKRADETFQNDASENSSDDDEHGGKAKKKRKVDSDAKPTKTPKSAKTDKKAKIETEKKSKKSAKKSARKPSLNDENEGDAQKDGPLIIKMKTPKKSTIKKLSVKRKEFEEKRRKSLGGGKVAKKLNLDDDDSSDDDVVDLEKHKADIESLKRDDPEFYKFLEENDASLLDFEVYPDEVDSENEDQTDAVQEDSEEDEDDHHTEEEDKPVRSTVKKSQDDDSDSDDSESENDEESNYKSPEKKRTPSMSAQKTKATGSSLKLKKSDEVKERQSMLKHSAKKSARKEANGNAISKVLYVEDSSDEESKAIKESTGANVVESESEESDAESTPLNGNFDEAKDVPLDVADYSDEDESDEDMAENEAAAEAGLANDIESESEEEEDEEEEEDNISHRVEKDEDTNRKLKLIDMQYLRKIQNQLDSNRSSLAACKELLRLFRAGREILPESKGLSKKQKEKQSSKAKGGDDDDDDMDVDEFEDDYVFTSGKVKFASAKAYQQAMNMCIIGIQDALDRMLGKPKMKEGQGDKENLSWDPKESKRWKNLEPIFRPFVRHLLELSDSVVEPNTLRFLLKRLERLVPYTKDNTKLLKKMLGIATTVWGSEGQHVSEATRLRSYLLLNRLAHGEGNAETVLRSCCNTYCSKIAKVCNSRTLPKIHFAVACLVELFSIDMGASYTTCFSFLREMALSLRAVMVSKNRSEEIERIHNWSYVNQLRLWSKVLGKHGGKDELHPLIYPYVQVSLGVMRVQPTPRTYPLRLHIASYLSDTIEETGTFIPLVPQILVLLRCSELRKKPSHGASKSLDWRGLLRVSDETVKTKPFLSLVINGVVLQIARYFSIIAKHVSFPELSYFASSSLKKVAKELTNSEWKSKLTSLANKLNQTSEIITKARAKADFSPQGAISPKGMLAVVPGISEEQKMPIQKFFEVERTRVAKEDALRVAKTEKDVISAPSAETEINSDSEPEPMIEERKPKKKNREKSRKGPTLSAPDASDEEDRVEALDLDSDSSDGE